MTTTKKLSNQAQANLANPNTMADVFRAMLVGLCLSPIKVVFSALGSSVAIDITTAASFAAVVSHAGLDTDGGGAGGQPLVNLPAIGHVKSLRPTTGSAGALARYIGDAGAAASTTVALVSDDGKTITFEAAVTGFVLEYYPAPAIDMTAAFADFD